MKLDPADLTRNARRTFSIALAGIPFLLARAIPWVSQTAVGARPSVVDALALGLFWLIYRGARWARWAAAVVAALSGVSGLLDAMLERAGGTPTAVVLVRAALGLLMLSSASILFGSSALDEPGPKQSLGVKGLPWERSLEPRWRSTANAGAAPLPVSRARRGGRIAPWILGVLAIGSWSIPALAAVWLVAHPTPPDPDEPAEASYYTSFANAFGAVLVVGAYIASLWIPIGGLLFVPLALAWRRPARFLVLRPFNRAQLSRTLARVIRAEVAPLGHCYTLADAAIHVSRWLRAPLVLGQMTTLVFRQRTVASPQDLERLARRMRRTWPRNLNWLASRSKIFPVACIHEAWRPCVVRLAAEADVIVVDLSAHGQSIHWELGLLGHTAHLRRTVFLVHEDAEAEVRDNFPELHPDPVRSISVYGSKGLRDPGALQRAILEIVAAPRAGADEERGAVTAFLNSDEAAPQPPPPPIDPGSTLRKRSGIGVLAAGVVVALVAWLQPGVVEPERPRTVRPEIAKAARALAERASELSRRPETARTAAALAAESLVRDPTPEADATLRAALALSKCDGSASDGDRQEWSAALPGPARLWAARSRSWLVAEVDGVLFGLNTETGGMSRLEAASLSGKKLIDLAVSDDGERIAVLTQEHGPPPMLPGAGDTVRLLGRSGDSLWQRDGLGALIGLGFVRDRLLVVTQPGKSGPDCPDPGVTGERWCGTLRDAESGAVVEQYRAHASAYRAIFSRDASVVAVTTNFAIEVWSTAAHARLSHVAGCYPFALSQDGRRFACARDGTGTGGEIAFGATSAEPEALARLTVPVAATSLLSSIDGRTLAAIERDGSLTIWDTPTQRATLRRTFTGARDLAFGAGERAVIVSDAAGLHATLVDPRDRVAKACADCDVAITNEAFQSFAPGETGWTCAVRK